MPKLRLSEVKVGQTFKTLKGETLVRIKVGDSHPNNYWLYNHASHSANLIDLVEAWDNFVVVDDNWKYLEREEWYQYGDTDWRLCYHYIFTDWFLQNINGKECSNPNLRASQVEEAKLWAENIIKDI
jgi:hypothetical protein